VKRFLIAVIFGSSGLWAQEPVPVSAFEVTLRPAVLNTHPGPEYSDEKRDYGMVIGTDRTPKGRIWAAWVAGGDSALAYFVLATSDDQGESWSKPRLVIHPPKTAEGFRHSVLVGNLWTDPTGKLWLFYDQSLEQFDGRAGVWAITCENPNSDQPVWSEPTRIWHGMTLNKPTVLKNGDWLLPVSLWDRSRISKPFRESAFPELDNQRMAHWFVSTAQGKSWQRRGGVAFPDPQFDEHMLVELKDGRLWMLARDNHGISQSFSADQGKTWSQPERSGIENPSSRFFLRRLASGNILLVKNGPLDRKTGRVELTAFLSDDEGKSWKGGLLIDERNDVSYPDGFQAPDGMIYTIHDRERAKEREILMTRFSEADILAGKFVTTGSKGKMMVSKALGQKPVKP